MTTPHPYDEQKKEYIIFKKTYLHFDTLFVKYKQKITNRGKHEFRLLPKTYKRRTEKK